MGCRNVERVNYASGSWFVLCVGLALSNGFVESSINTPGSVLLDRLAQQSYWESYFESYFPILKTLKRQIRWLDTNTVSVTLIYQATEPVQARWFLGGDDSNLKRLNNSEVPFKLPVNGNPNCRLRYTRSGQVTAAVLTIRSSHIRLPYVVETILTTRSNTIQYQLITTLRSRSESRTESIDSPEWLLVPKAEVAVQAGGVLDLHCVALVPKESSTYSNELAMSRINVLPSGPERLISIDDVVMIHKDTQNVIEGDQKTALFVGKRYRTRLGHVIYHVGLSSRNVRSEDDFAGVYQCFMERLYDRLYVRFTVQRPPAALTPPSVVLVSCEAGNYKVNKTGRFLIFTAGVATCFRCRASGRPTPVVAAYRNDDELAERKGLGVAKYVNVVEAGVAEATYAFHSPAQGVDDGSYSCKARNSNQAVHFKIEVRQAGPGKTAAGSSRQVN